MAGDEDEAQEVVVSRAVGECGLGEGATAASPSSSRASAPCRPSIDRARRKRSMARFRAVAMSQAPGLSGTPDSGQRSSAATSASCASSSAIPTSRTTRASAAMSRADSMRQTARMALWTSAADTQLLRG